MVVKLSSLRVSADFDANSYARGARDKVTADNMMIASGDAWGSSLARADAALNRAIPGVARLSCSYIDGYSASDKFQRALQQISNALDKGMDVDRAVAMVVNLENGLHRVADAAALAKAGLGNVAAAVDTAHIDQSGLNTLLGVNTGTSRSAAASGAAFEEALAAQEKMQASAARLRAEIDPLSAAQGRLNEELAQYNELAAGGFITTDELGKAQVLSTQRFQAATDALQKHAGSAKLSNFELVNMHYQLSDIAVSLASGQSPFTVAMQQGSQLAQIFQANGMKLSDVFKSMGTGIITFIANPLNLAVLGAGALAAGGVLAYRELLDNGERVKDNLEKQKSALADLREAYASIQRNVLAIGPSSIPTVEFAVRFNMEAGKKLLLEQMQQLRDEVNSGKQARQYNDTGGLGLAFSLFQPTA